MHVQAGYNPPKRYVPISGGLARGALSPEIGCSGWAALRGANAEWLESGADGRERPGAIDDVWVWLVEADEVVPTVHDR